MESIILVTNPQQTIDVSGAGDTFMASFVIKLLTYKLSRGTLLTIANEVCADVVNKKGVSAYLIVSLSCYNLL